MAWRGFVKWRIATIKKLFLGIRSKLTSLKLTSLIGGRYIVLSISDLLIYLAILLFIFLLSWFSSPVQAETAGSFSTAKEWAEDVYGNGRVTFYCGCSYSASKVVDKESCGYVPRRPFTRSGKINKRANRAEWEHVLPASIMGKGLTCWGKGRGKFPQCVKSNGKLISGRACCQKVNKTFRRAHNDLVNLVPAIGEINADRSNHRYGIVEGEPRKYGLCDFEFRNRVAEPRIGVRGNIARIQLYLLEKYGSDLGFSFSADRLEMLQEWDDVDPVSEVEIKKNIKLCRKQGFGNPLVSDCVEVN